MPRPPCCRRIAYQPVCVYFKPRGVPMTALEEVVLGLDELEAIRLADLEGLYQEEAAGKMNISRPTFTRLIESARRKVAEAVVKGKALKLEGGNIMLTTMRRFRCSDCQHTWEIPHGTGRPRECPQCSGKNLHRAEEDRGRARHGGPGGRGQGCSRKGGGRATPRRTSKDSPTPTGSESK